MARKDSVTVPMDAELRAYVEALAAREERSVASVVRRLIQAARTAGEARAA